MLPTVYIWCHSVTSSLWVKFCRADGLDKPATVLPLILQLRTCPQLLRPTHARAHKADQTTLKSVGVMPGVAARQSTG